MEVQKILQTLNTVDYKKLSELNIGEKYEVEKLESTNTTYGRRIIVYCDNFKVLLPEQLSNIITENHIKTINKSNHIIYLQYYGLLEWANGTKRKHKVLLTIDTDSE